MAHRYDICLDVGGTKILGIIFNEKKEIVFRIKKRTREDFEDLENAPKVFRCVIDEMIRESGISRKELRAICAGVPSSVDEANGIILMPPNLPWRNVPIRDAMEKEYGVPFYICNDVDLGVLGEHRYGAAQGYGHVAGFFVGTGIGGGLILNGSIYSGHLSKGGELGHMILNPDGPLCACGQRGCLEAFSSKSGMSAYIREQAKRGRETMLAPHVRDGVFKSKYLKKALKKEDPVTLEAVDRACHYLAVGTGSLINLISPQVVIYGGGVMEAVGEIFLEKIRAEVGRYAMPPILSTVELKVAALGDDSVVYGALAVIEDRK